MAINRRRPPPGLTVHSDQSALFAAAANRQLLARHGFVDFMSRKGNCYDNVYIEAFCSTLKYELGYRRRFATYAKARTATFNYIEVFYNWTSVHSNLGYKNPEAYESHLK